MSRLKSYAKQQLLRLNVRTKEALLRILPPAAIERLKRLRDRVQQLREARRRSPRALRELALHEVEVLTARPLISLVMPTYKTELRYLRAAVDSVRGQCYPEWELCVVDDGSGDPELVRVMNEYAAGDRRVKFKAAAENAGISAASNAGLEMCTGEFVGFLDHDDALTADALLRVAQALEADPELDVVYTDQDKLDARGLRADPFLKPDWSPVYALGAMYIGHLLVVRRQLAEAVGGFDPAFDTIQDFEFLLRVSERTDRIHHVPQITYHWRAIPGSIAAGAEEKSGVPELQARAVTAHLERIGAGAVAKPHPRIPHRAVLAPQDEDEQPRVSVVVAASQGGARLQRLLDSLAAAGDSELETIVAGAAAPKGAGGPGVVAVEAGPGPFNRARANNAAADKASGEYLLFLDEAAEIVDPDSIEQLLLHCRLPGVGAVGPMLVGAGDSVVAAGVAIGLDRPAMPISAGIPADGDGYYGSLPCAHEVSAIASDCMLVERRAFDRVGGFNEFYAGGYEDFDLCQRLARAGFSTVYAPRPRVVTHRPPAKPEREDFVDRALFVDCWYDELVAGDPYFNPGFGRRQADYSPAGWRHRVLHAGRRTR